MDCDKCVLTDEECKNNSCEYCKYENVKRNERPCLECYNFDCKFIPNEGLK